MSEASPYLEYYEDEILDIGAGNGEYIQKFSVYLPKRRVHSFEPVQNINTISIWNIGLHHKIALSNYIGRGIMRYKNESPDGAELNVDYLKGATNYSSMEVPVSTLDAIVSKDKFLNYFRIGFMKIDVEGHELEVLQGAKKTLKKTLFAYIEISRNEWKVLKLMQEAGFKLLWVSEWNNYFFKKRRYDL